MEFGRYRSVLSPPINLSETVVSLFANGTRKNLQPLICKSHSDNSENPEFFLTHLVANLDLNGYELFKTFIVSLHMDILILLLKNQCIWLWSAVPGPAGDGCSQRAYTCVLGVPKCMPGRWFRRMKGCNLLQQGRGGQSFGGKPGQAYKHPFTGVTQDALDSLAARCDSLWGVLPARDTR